MSLRDRVPVEPLAPERWGHLEQRVVAHAGEALARPAPRRWWPVVAAIGVAGAVAAAAIGLRPPPVAATPPMIVSADATGAHVELGDAVIDATPGTRFEVTRPDGGVRIALAEGAVTLDVAPRKDRPPLWVIAGDVSVRVVGTAFTVRRDPDVTVTVAHGVVEVDRAGAAVAVRAGQRWTAGGVVAVAAADDGVDDPAAANPNAGAGGGDRIASGTTGPDTMALSATPDVGLRDRRKGDVTPPVARGGNTGANGANGANGGTGANGANGSANANGGATRPRPAAAADAAADKPAPALSPAADLRNAIAAQPVPPAPPIDAATPADAIAAYQRELVTARGAAASAALWGLARTQWAQGKKADALRSLDVHVRRFTSGAEADAVLWLRMRLLCARAFDDTCRAAAHTYATRAADGPRRDLAIRATQTR